MVDPTEPHAFGNGFDRSVCEGCPHKTKVMMGTVDGCGLCGCPFATLARVRGGSPPEACPRLAAHAREAGRT